MKKPAKQKTQAILCACGKPYAYTQCCGRFVDEGVAAATAEHLMRSRYTAYTLGRENYLLKTWHPDTRPTSLQLAVPPQKQWLGLTVKRHAQTDADHAIVEFIARYKINGHAHRLHEISRFVREQGIWFYVDGDILAGR